MKLDEMLMELIERGEPTINVGCYSKENPDRHVQVRLAMHGDGIGFNWTWFGFVDPNSPDWTAYEVANLYLEASQSDEWYLDEIEVEPE